MHVLTKVLAENGGDAFPLGKICEGYCDWVAQDNFKELIVLRMIAVVKNPQHMRLNVVSSGSKDNDLFIRAVPITIWGRNLTE